MDLPFLSTSIFLSFYPQRSCHSLRMRNNIPIWLFAFSSRVLVCACGRHEDVTLQVRIKPIFRKLCLTQPHQEFECCIVVAQRMPTTQCRHAWGYHRGTACAAPALPWLCSSKALFASSSRCCLITKRPEKGFKAWNKFLMMLPTLITY